MRVSLSRGGTGAGMEVASIALLPAALAGAALGAVVAFALRRGPRKGDSPRPNGDDSVALLAAFEDPLLVVRDRRVLIANPAARALLGDHIEGPAAPPATRPPAAAEHLAGRDDGGERVRIELVGLGELGRPWEMMLTPLAGGSPRGHPADRGEGRAAAPQG